MDAKFTPFVQFRNTTNTINVDLSPDFFLAECTDFKLQSALDKTGQTISVKVNFCNITLRVLCTDNIGN